MEIRKIFIVETSYSDTIITEWIEKHPGFLKETLHYVLASKLDSLNEKPSQILEDTLKSIKLYSHLESNQILVLFAGEHTNLLKKKLPCQSLDLLQIKREVSKLFNGFNSAELEKLAPWIISGRIFATVK